MSAETIAAIKKLSDERLARMRAIVMEVIAKFSGSGSSITTASTSATAGGGGGVSGSSSKRPLSSSLVSRSSSSSDGRVHHSKKTKGDYVSEDELSTLMTKSNTESDSSTSNGGDIKYDDGADYKMQRQANVN